MVRPGRDRLAGYVEADETYWGGGKEGKRGRHLERRTLIVIAVEQVRRGEFGRIRVCQVLDVSADNPQAFIGEAVEQGTVVNTDGWLGYERIDKSGYCHRITFLEGRKESPSDLFSHVHGVASLFKRCLLGTRLGAVSVEHLDCWMDKFTSCFNRRINKHRSQFFYRLVQQADAVDAVRYQRLVGGKHNILRSP